MLAYVLSGLKQLRDFEIFTAEIETEDKVITVDVSAVTIANAAPPSSVLAQGTAGVIFDDGLVRYHDSCLSKAGAIATSSCCKVLPVKRLYTRRCRIVGKL